MRTIVPLAVAAALIATGPAAAFNMHVPRTAAAAAIPSDHQAVLRLAVPDTAPETAVFGRTRFGLFGVLAKAAVRLALPVIERAEA